MIDKSQAVIHAVSAHSIIKNDGRQELNYSEAPLNIESDLLKSPLLLYFLSNFNTPEYYHFSFSGEDAASNPISTFSKQIFDNGPSFHHNSINIAKHLVAASEHPNIKAGDVYIAHFSGVRIDGETLEAVGIFKSESKETYLKLRSNSKKFSIDVEEGVNVRKLDKGCLVLNTLEAEGYKIVIVDNANKTDAQYWKQDFLNIKPCADAFHQTHNFMNLTRLYVGDQLDEEFSVSKADKIDLLNRSVNFFKSREIFKQDEFETEVFEDPSVIESFRKFERSMMPDEGVADDFEISAQAVKRQARIFKSVLKLDKNFHIYIHGNRELIEKGFDQSRNRHFYKIYFDQET
jgi:hypothetical protein